MLPPLPIQGLLAEGLGPRLRPAFFPPKKEGDFTMGTLSLATVREKEGTRGGRARDRAIFLCKKNEHTYKLEPSRVRSAQQPEE